MEEIINSIRIGFCQPKFYKRSVWNKALKVMNWLVKNTNGEVFEQDFGRGKGKFATRKDVNDATLREWATKYKQAINI